MCRVHVSLPDFQIVCFSIGNEKYIRECQGEGAGLHLRFAKAFPAMARRHLAVSRTNLRNLRVYTVHTACVCHADLLHTLYSAALLLSAPELDRSTSPYVAALPYPCTFTLDDACNVLRSSSPIRRNGKIDY